VAKRPVSAWDQWRQKSVALRRRFEDLVKEFDTLGSSDKEDAISGARIANAEFQAWKEMATSVFVSSGQIVNSLQKRRTEDSETLEERLTRALRSAGLSVYGETALLIINGIVHIEIDSKKDVVLINGRAASELSVPVLQDLTISQIEQTSNSTSRPETFLSLLLHGYESEIAQAGKTFGTQVRTSSLHWQLTLQKQQQSFRSNPTAATFREYPRELFRADLYRLLEANLTVLENRRFCYASGSDTTGAVFTLVPQLGRTAYVGRIWFE
jgi:hypothetical protein